MSGPHDRLGDDLRAICDGLAAITGRLSVVEDKLDILLAQVAKVPSGSRMFGTIIGTFVAAVTILGGALGVAQWLKLIPR